MASLRHRDGRLSGLRKRQPEAPTLDVTSQPYEIQEGVAIVQSFVENMRQMPCYNCKRAFATEIDIEATVKQWHTGTRALSEPHVICTRSCPRCRASVGKTCLGCGQMYKKKRARIRDHNLDWCCNEGRLVSIWMILCRYDQICIGHQQTQTSAAISTRNASSVANNASTSNGTGYGKHVHDYGSGYSSWTTGGLTLDAPTLRLKEETKSLDQACVQLIDLLIILFPSVEDGDVPIALPHMIELSLVLDKSAEVLRNDSLEDCMQRTLIFGSTLSLVEKLGENHGLCQLVQAERYSKASSPGLHPISLGYNPSPHHTRARAPPIKMVEQKDGKDQSLVKGLENLALQSTVVLKSPQVDPELGKMCQRISAVYDALAHLQFHTEATAMTPQQQWSRFHKVNALSFSDDILKDFRPDLLKEADDIAKKLQNARTDGARNKRILTECANMKTSLDDGTFLIVAESRPDIMKALLVGPQDTAYAHGLFEFDILLPESYPRAPPKVYVKYPHNVSSPEINPNLHPNGLVCLSLLGTWHQGDAVSRWQPGVSTILQVLISIRAMVFAPDALHNEPMLEGRLVDTEVLRYNHHVQPLVVWAFMLCWMKEEKACGGVWRDVVRVHFGLRGEECVEVLKGWAQSNGKINKWDGSLVFRLGEARYLWGGSRVEVDLVRMLEETLAKLRTEGEAGEMEALLNSLIES